MIDGDQGVARLERLEPFVGEWRLEAPAFPLSPELADAAHSTFEWALGRAFLLHQRWLGAFSANGNTINGRWEKSPNGHDWELDFELAYRRLT